MEDTTLNPTLNQDDSYEALEKQAHFHEIQMSIAFQQHRLSAVKSKMNLFSPAVKLPPEIMSLVFSFVKEKQFSKPYELPRWVSATTHVCRRWREVAINSAELWCDPPILNGQGMAEVLARSKVLDLDIDIVDKDCEYMRPMTEELSRHAPRIKRLTVNFLTDRISNILNMLTVRNWKLHSLFLTGSFFIEDELIHVPDDLLKDTQELRHLRLSRCGFDWSLLRHPHLVKLHLGPFKENNRPDFLVFIAAIRGMPLLESLELYNSFHAPVDPLPEHVHLPRLKTLCTLCGISDGDALFHSLVLPASTQIKIIVHVQRGENRDITSFIRNAVLSRPAVSEAVIYRSLSIIEQLSHNCRFELSSFTDHLNNGTTGLAWNVDRKSQFSLTFTWANTSTSNFTAGVCVALSALLDSGIRFDALSHVYMESYLRNVSIHRRLLRDTIGKLPAVSFILTTGGMNTPFIRALRSVGADPETLKLHYFPNLTDIALLRRGLTYRNVEAVCEFNCDILEKSLIRRRKCKAAINNLLLGRELDGKDQFTDAHLAKLRGAVEDVVLL